MPTGYTADIKDGITFEEFALNCARAFGACITLRDESRDKPIPEKFEPSDYHTRNLDEAKEKLNSLEQMTIKEAGNKAEKEYKEKLQSYQDSIKKSIELESKYNKILLQVKRWHPPTSEHEGLKKFMVDQINNSIDFDCGSDYYYKEIDKLKLLVGAEWKIKEIQKCLENIEYHATGKMKEIDSIDQKNQWISDLRASL